MEEEEGRKSGLESARACSSHVKKATLPTEEEEEEAVSLWNGVLVR